MSTFSSLLSSGEKTPSKEFSPKELADAQARLSGYTEHVANQKGFQLSGKRIEEGKTGSFVSRLQTALEQERNGVGSRDGRDVMQKASTHPEKQTNGQSKPAVDGFNL